MTVSNKTPKKISGNALSKRRIRLVEVGSIVVCLLFVSFFAGKYLISPFFSSKKQGTKNEITYEAISSYVIEGDIVDRDGDVIMGYASAGVPASANAPENEAYAYLLGYYTVDSGQENAYGLRGNLKDYSLFHLDADDKGATVQLTTDNALQDYAYELLNGQEGSITVIDNDTGAILALASHSTITYDVNDMDSFLNSDVEGAQYRRGTYENDPPGSTFKMITAAAALTKQEDEGFDDSYFDFYDTGTYLPEGSDWTIHNYGDYAYGDIGLSEAMESSVNCYFADLGIRVGQEYLSSAAEAFKIGEDIEIPFLTTLHSSFSFSDDQPVTISQTSYGQGDTQITPVHLALIAEAIANDGVMMSPYIVSSITSGKLPLYKHFDSELSSCISDTVDSKLKDVLHATALKYGLDEYNYGMVYAKTGTAECANDRIHTYLVGFTEDASFCISFNDSDISYSLYPVAQKLVAYINTLYAE